MLTNKDYCDYDTCVALEELGFREPTLTHYIENYPNNLIYHYCDDACVKDCYKRVRSRDGVFGAPTLYEAQKWLREEKKIHIEVYACAGGYMWELCKAYETNTFSGGTTIYTPNDVNNPKLNDAGRYNDFESCLSDGIKEIIKILKEYEAIHE